jgi:hypothetical protein
MNPLQILNLFLQFQINKISPFNEKIVQKFSSHSAASELLPTNYLNK